MLPRHYRERLKRKSRYPRQYRTAPITNPDKITRGAGWRSLAIPESLTSRMDGFIELEEFDEEIRDEIDEDQAAAPTARPRTPESPVSDVSESVSSEVQGQQHLDHQLSSADQLLLSGWCGVDLDPRIAQALILQKFFKPTEIQRQAIPVIQEGNDVIGQAVTGSGKTLAYGIPILHSLLQSSGRSALPRALIVAPTRELAQQIQIHLNRVSLHTNLQMILLIGGLAIEKQRRLLARNPQVVIGTPGRLDELLRSGDLVITELLYLVVDEADRLLRDGNYAELKHILRELPKSQERRSLIFSATFGNSTKISTKNPSHPGKRPMSSKENVDASLRSLISDLQLSEFPKIINAQPTTKISTQIDHSFIRCAALQKDLYLFAAVTQTLDKIMVFSNSVKDVVRIGKMLSALSRPTFVLHSSKQQKARLKAIEGVTKTNHSILVATDVAARGLDVSDIKLVIHYHLPRTAELYIHRSGRTGRGSQFGKSLLICSPTEKVAMEQLIQSLHATRFSPAELNLSASRHIYQQMLLAKRISNLSNNFSSNQPASSSTLGQAAADLGVDLDDAPKLKSHRQAVELKALRTSLKRISAQPSQAQKRVAFPTKGGAEYVRSILHH